MCVCVCNNYGDPTEYNVHQIVLVWTTDNTYLSVC